MKNEEKATLIFIIDESGSMNCVTSDTIGTYNSLLAEHKNTGKNIFVTLVLFNSEVKKIYSHIPIDEVAELTTESYCPCSTTALCDAVCETLEDEFLHQLTADEEDKTDKTLVFIVTDGLENASRKYHSGDVGKMVTATKKMGWQYAFYGANFDVEKIGKSYSLAREDLTPFEQTHEGMIRFKHSSFKKMMDFLN